MGDAGGDEAAFVAQALGRGAQGLPQLGQAVATAVAQRDVLEVVPDTLVGVEIGRITGQAFQMHAGRGPVREEVFDGLAPMDGRAVPDASSLPALWRTKWRKKRTTSGPL